MPRCPAIRKLKGRPVTVVVTINGLKPGDPAGMEPAVAGPAAHWATPPPRRACGSPLYNHVSCWNESVPFNIELVKKVNHPQVGFNFNVCHWLKVEGDKDYRPLLRANRRQALLRDPLRRRSAPRPGPTASFRQLDQGDFDNRALLATLREIGYKGPVGIMCYGIPRRHPRVSRPLAEGLEELDRPAVTVRFP